jgi:P-type E1-E2 ATPase
VLDELRGLGFERIIMLTGDNARTAARIAAEADIDEFCADMLPEAKHAYLEELRATGHKVVMVGDGVNDTPALALADVGIAMGDGAAIAREVADITLSGDDVRALCDLRRMSTAFISRMAQSSRFAIGFNTAVLALGIFGVITPTLSSAAHNISTVALSIGNARRYLPET